MPAAAVARRTPATGGMSGKRAGASGETAVAMAQRGPGTIMAGENPGHDDEDDQRDGVNRFYFFSGGCAGLARRSIFASARSLVTRSTCALRTTYVSSWSFTLSNSGGCFLRLSSTLSTCQPNCVLTGSEILPLSSLKATVENSGTICSLVK